MPSRNSRRWLCLDCGVDTSRAREHYFVTRGVWFDEAGAQERGMLCIGCLERRIGRRLVRGDFPPVHINDPHRNSMSARLVDRLTAT